MCRANQQQFDEKEMVKIAERIFNDEKNFNIEQENKKRETMLAKAAVEAETAAK